MTSTWHLRWPGAWIFLAAVILCGALMFASYALVGPVRQTTENCEAIERHKAFHREEAAFDLRGVREVLRDLSIDPDSRRGQRLIERGEKTAVREQGRFKAEEC